MLEMTEPNDTSDLRVRVNALEHADAAIITRLTSLEQWQRTTEISEARKDEKWNNVDKRFDDLDKKIEKVSGVLTKIMWLVLGGIIMAGVGFVVNGGMRIP